ncbi:MAG: AMP-binding protein [Parachlamydiales bacterium]|jgi:O-succinylbenzoic acid--CoA ligase
MDRAKDPIDWLSSATHILTNPRLSPEESARIISILESPTTPEGLLWFSTSGSTGDKGIQKWVGISRGALLTSARSVNHHLECDSDDIWLNVLPVFHVGGCSIYARAELSGSPVYELKEWSPQEFVNAVSSLRITLSSLVPAQVHDLVQKELPAPKSLKAIVVGGGVLSHPLYQKARALGWPLLPSYGMTECGSQIATAPLESLMTEALLPPLNILPHIHHKVDEEGRLHIKSPSLLSAYAHISENGYQFEVFPKDHWLKTDDIVDIQGDTIQHKGRKGDFIKIGGESVLLPHLEEIWQQAAADSGLTVQETAISPVVDERLGYTIELFTTASENQISQALNLYNDKVLPFERIRKVNQVESIPRSALGKLLRHELSV